MNTSKLYSMVSELIDRENEQQPGNDEFLAGIHACYKVVYEELEIEAGIRDREKLNIAIQYFQRLANAGTRCDGDQPQPYDLARWLGEFASRRTIEEQQEEKSEKCDFPSYEEAVQMSEEEFTECVRRAAGEDSKV